MTNEFNKNYSYDRCSSRGICSVNPTTASLQEVILLYLKHTAHYGLNFIDFGIEDKTVDNLILNTISILSTNYEISENNFKMINFAFQKELPNIIEKYKGICEELKREPVTLDTEKILSTNSDINYFIKLGEKAFNKRMLSYDNNLGSFYKMIFVLVKSMTINILIYESFGKNASDEIILLFKLLNLLNNPKKDKEELKKLILEISEKDCTLMKKIRTVQEQEYGIQTQTEVSFSTIKGKAVLVVGSNLKELEQILDRFENKNIDIYTHDNMILAHTFPKFRSYSHLKGQFGQGMENCLLDFSTFPGPIILTRNSLFNIENLYRGRLYTTDFAYSKGVIQIKDDDFSEVIKSAEESRGFKTGKNCEAEIVGFSYEETVKKIYKRLEEYKFKQIIIIGIEGYNNSDKSYFKTLLNHIPDETLILSMSCCNEKTNRICLNAIYDTISVLKLAEELILNSNIPVSIFYPYCDRHTLSLIIYLNSISNGKFFIGKWNNSTINPNIIDILKTEYNIFEITTPKNDLEKLTNA